jgi:hypothetical protein
VTESELFTVREYWLKLFENLRYGRHLPVNGVAPDSNGEWVDPVLFIGMSSQND